MAGMWIVNIEVTDPDSYSKYLEKSGDVVESKGGTFIARAGRYTQKEGREYPRNVVVRFESYEQALAAYESEDYQAVLPDAIAGSDRQLVIVETND